MNFISELPLNPTRRVLRQFAGGWLVCFLALAFRFGLPKQAHAGEILALVSFAGVLGLIVPRLLHWPFVVLPNAYRIAVSLFAAPLVSMFFTWKLRP